jgi:CubicO group peptidase (beta-lactamase class C family)
LSAELTLDIPGGRCELRYTVEPDPPHGLLELRLGVMLGGGPPGGLGLATPQLELDLPRDDDDALATALDRQLEDLAAHDAFSGVVLLARNGEPFFYRAYGDSNRERGLANTVDTRFDIGSITKLLTRVAVAQLAQASTLDLEATVQSVLPDYPNPAVGSRITIQQLLDHSSGLGDIFNERWEEGDRSTMLAPRDFFPLFVDLPLQFEPGTSSSYSNAGFVVLGAIVEKVSGEPYVDYLARHVFAPAGMKDSGFPVRDGSDPGLAIGYTREGGGELRPNLGMLPLRGCPAGSSSHTAADLMRLDRALRGGRLLDARWTAWVYTGALGDSPGSAWQIAILGGAAGVSAALDAGPALTIVVLANLDPPTAAQTAQEVSRALAR